MGVLRLILAVGLTAASMQVFAQSAGEPGQPQAQEQPQSQKQADKSVSSQPATPTQTPDTAPKDEIKILLLEGISESAVNVLRGAGYTNRSEERRVGKEC